MNLGAAWVPAGRHMQAPLPRTDALTTGVAGNKSSAPANTGGLGPCPTCARSRTVRRSEYAPPRSRLINQAPCEHGWRGSLAQGPLARFALFDAMSLSLLPGEPVK